MNKDLLPREEEKKLDVGLEQLQAQAIELKNKISYFEQHLKFYTIPWEELLAQFGLVRVSVEQLLKSLTREHMPNLRESVLMPSRISTELDEFLRNTTEGRFQNFTHNTVPDVLLRTKLIPQLENEDNALTASTSNKQISEQQAEAMIKEWKKCCDIALAILKTRKFEEIYPADLGAQTTTEAKSAKMLMNAIETGVGLTPGKK